MDRLPPAGAAGGPGAHRRDVTDSREVNPGEVWEENEFWIELSWRIDPDGAWASASTTSPADDPGEKLRVDEYYGWMFENSVPGLPERRRPRG